MYADITSNSKVEIEAILMTSTDDRLQLKTDETAKPIWVRKTGIRMKSTGNSNKDGAFVKLIMSERKAVNAGLV